MLFISSYIPLYILLILKNVFERCTKNGRITITIEKIKKANFFDEINDYAIVILLLMVIISFSYLLFLIKQEGGSHSYEILRVEDQTGSVYFNYISIYLLSCLGLSLNSFVDVFVLFFLMLLVGYIYITNHMTYMNPVLQFLGYKVLECEVESKSTKQIISAIIIVGKNTGIHEGEIYIGSGDEDFIFIKKQ